MSTFVVSLFLPYTVNFHEETEKARKPRPHSRRMPSRVGSALDIRELTKTTSLLDGPVSPATPAGHSHADLLSRFGLDDEDPHKHSYKPGNPRGFVRNDAHVPDWGTSHLLNQPKSRADSFISGSILDYEHQKQAQIGDVKGYAQSHAKLPQSIKSRRERTGSQDRSFNETAAWTVEPAIQGNGSLTNAVRSSSELEDYHRIFVGTLGFPTDALSDQKKEEIHGRLENEYDSLVTYITDKDFNGHYSHFCKTILWPIFHYQVPDHPKSKAYEDHSWKYYKAVNQNFADKIVASYKSGDVIWVHDYHLLLVPGMIRDKIPDAQIGFFLHTAFPSSEIFRCLSSRKELLHGMLGANLIAFQTREYAGHFLSTCSRLLVTEVTSAGVQLENRFINVTSQPLGIDPNALDKARQDSEVVQWIEELKKKYQGKKLIIARDKLDHVRGVRQKLLAFELFLKKYPEWREKVVLLQVATVATENNNELLAVVADITTRIDAQYSTLSYQPVQLLMQDMSFTQYVALLSYADCLMVSSLREGMGLNAHEFIFCQDGALTDRKHGPVILSEFTGAAAVIGNHGLLINPWDYHDFADKIRMALEMSAEEKETRHKKAYEIVTHYTGAHWAKQLRAELLEFYKEQSERNQLAIPRLDTRDLCEKYNSSQRRLFILDSEGTLSAYGPNKNAFAQSQEPIFDTLNELVADDKNIVYVMSSRTPEVLERVFSHVPRLGLVAENGSFVREYGSKGKHWIAFHDSDKVEAWKADVSKVLKYYSDRIEGSYIEERHCSLVLHYDKAEDPESAHAQAGDCVNYINDSCETHRIHAVPIERSVLIESMDCSKGTAASKIYDSLTKNQNVPSEVARPDPDFLMTAGDDREDEGVFQWANDLSQQGIVKNVCTVSMGRRNTQARATLTQGPAGLLSALQKLSKSAKANQPEDYFSRPGTPSSRASGGAGSTIAANLYWHH
ncbi:hypothetical protein MBLNU457_7019t1 [Dothideomycetes sp. NU457]